MAGVRQLLKQAQKMQQKMEAVQAELAERIIEHSAGGGAVVVTITGAQEFQSLKIDPEFLKEDADMVEETLLTAIQEAAAKAKAVNEEEMGKVSQGMAGGFPGLM